MKQTFLATLAALGLAAPAAAQDLSMASAETTRETVRDVVPALRANAPENEDTRIVGGRPAEPGTWPAAVSLHDPARLDGTAEGVFLSQFCGGTIITPQWILTAAHCVVDDDGAPLPPEGLAVRTSSHIVYEGDLRRVARVIVHAEYDMDLFDHDIALLQLAAPITEASGPVDTVPLIPQGEVIPNAPAMVIGWGMLDDGSFPDVLMETNIEVVPNSACNDGMAEQARRELGGFLLGMGESNGIPMDALEEAFAILSTNINPRLTENMICAGIPSGQRSSCSGDSGGPLLMQASDGDWVQVGIVSWGREPLSSESRCANEDLYAVYTRLSVYFDWIAGHVGG
jgi:secreted trypsin-like serine protease